MITGIDNKKVRENMKYINVVNGPHNEWYRLYLASGKYLP